MGVGQLSWAKKYAKCFSITRIRKKDDEVFFTIASPSVMKKTDIGFNQRRPSLRVSIKIYGTGVSPLLSLWVLVTALFLHILVLLSGDVVLFFVCVDYTPGLH